MKKGRRSAPIFAILIGLICIFFPRLAYSGQAERIFGLPELEGPRQIVAKKGKVYFVDKRDVIVYNLSDGRFLKRIGKLGQGPGEFTMGPSRLSILGDRLIVKSLRRYGCFNLEGVHIGEISEPDPIAFYQFLPVGRNFVGFPMIRNDDGTLSAPTGRIYGSNLKLKQEFFGELPAFPAAPPPPGSAKSTKKSDKLLIRDYGDYTVYEDRIYVADSSRGFSISIFDENGILLGEINHPVDRVKVPKSFVDGVVKEWKASNEWQNNYAYINPVVPEYFPALIDFKIDSGRIYALTSAKKGNLFEIIVMDIEGKILSREFRFPLVPNYEMPFFNGFKYDIAENKLVWFAYSDAKEM